MNRLSKLGSKFKQIVSPTSTLPAETQAIQPKSVVTQEQRAAKLAKRPDIYILKMLLSNGPMTSTQIWRTYQRQVKDSKANNQTFEQFFQSKSQLKQKCLKIMRQSNRIKSQGYNHRSKEHLGWTVNPDKAFRNLRAPIKEQLKSLERK